MTQVAKFTEGDSNNYNLPVEQAVIKQHKILSMIVKKLP